MSIINQVKTRLKELRGEGIPPTVIARKAGVPQSTISRFLSGRTSISARNLEKLLPVLFESTENALQHKIN
jgi:transcriptional regulator with XRE-family HTH domain